MRKGRVGERKSGSLKEGWKRAEEGEGDGKEKMSRRRRLRRVKVEGEEERRGQIVNIRSEKMKEREERL
jgi:hypothetical protein